MFFQGNRVFIKFECGDFEIIYLHHNDAEYIVNKLLHQPTSFCNFVLPPPYFSCAYFLLACFLLAFSLAHVLVCMRACVLASSSTLSTLYAEVTFKAEVTFSPQLYQRMRKAFRTITSPRKCDRTSIFARSTHHSLKQ